jgi:hypothetical protein
VFQGDLPPVRDDDPDRLGNVSRCDGMPYECHDAADIDK